MDTPAIIGTTLLAVGLGALIVIRLNRDEQFGDEFANPYGDVPAIPQVSAAGGEIVAGGRGTEQAARRKDQDIARHDRGAI